MRRIWTVGLATILAVSWSVLGASGALAATAAPTITSFSPGSGGAGTKVVVTGTGFTGTSTVQFNGVKAAFTVDSSTQITAQVPYPATTGPIGVTGEGGGTLSPTYFNVTSPVVPVISSFDQHFATTYARIYGTGFLNVVGICFATIRTSQDCIQFFPDAKDPKAGTEIDVYNIPSNVIAGPIVLQYRNTTGGVSTVATSGSYVP
jgi:IPT/TIG domain